MRHHEDLEHQFTILSGHTDIILDKVSEIIPPRRYDLWIFIGVAWFTLPFCIDIYFRKRLIALDTAELKLDDDIELSDKLS